MGLGKVTEETVKREIFRIPIKSSCPPELCYQLEERFKRGTTRGMKTAYREEP